MTSVTGNKTYSLPQPQEDQAFVKVSALDGGYVSVRLKLMVEDAPNDEERKLLPAMAFLLEHSKTREKFLFDLGIRKNLETLSPMNRDDIARKFPTHVPQSVEESLKKGGMDPEDIQMIILSHLHYDQ
jgi:glyoxylase-like metal-dependent hydrolase (beta-lactamase superfamily II)